MKCLGFVSKWRFRNQIQLHFITFNYIYSESKELLSVLSDLKQRGSNLLAIGCSETLQSEKQFLAKR